MYRSIVIGLAVFLMTIFPAFAGTTIAVNDSFTMNQGDTLTVSAPGILDNDQGDLLYISALIDSTKHGSLEWQSDGSFSYVPDPVFWGADTFAYEVTDGDGGVDTGLVFITVQHVSQVLAAVNDAYTVNRESTLVVVAPGLLANDSGYPDIVVSALIKNTKHGLLSLGTDGSFSFTPAEIFSRVDTFAYQIKNKWDALDTGYVFITIINNPPEAVNDYDTVNRNETLAVAAPGILENDSDPDNDPLIVNAVIKTTRHGSLQWATDGSFTYVPTHDFSGADTFSYRISDGNGGLDTGLVFITVTPLVPVTLSSFTATAENGGIALAWITQTEQDNLGWNILRSQSATTGFVQINNLLIPGAGTSALPQQYTFMDAGVADGTWYYRLEQVDITGGKSYSPVVSTLMQTTGITATPIATDDYFGLAIANPGREINVAVHQGRTENTTISIYDMQGNLIAQTNGPRLHTAAQPGIYLVKVVAGEHSQTTKLLIYK